ncbi:MAG: hypothetical protein PHY44_07220 [Lachnospiraceae bacterium]|nr:hypothetical protein [Lachnospiraceae bacterium]
MEKLSQEFNSTITNLADKISRKLGGFFGESGSTGETQKIYDSIVNAYCLQ